MPKPKSTTLQYLQNLYLEFCRRYAVPLLLAVIGLVVFAQHFQIGFNFSDSLPGKVFLINKQKNDISQLKHGDIVTFIWQGDFYARGTRFTKMVAGMPGDVVTRRGREIFINGKSVGVAKEFAKTGEPLQVNTFEGVIPMPYIYVVGKSKDSLDSRYETTGLVGAGQVVGRAIVIF